MKRLLGFLLGATAPSRCTVSAFLSIAPKTSSSPLLVNPSSPITSDARGCLEITTSNRLHSGGSFANRRSPSSSSSALAASPLNLATVGTTVAKFYKAFPLVAGFLTASTKACFADSLAQYRDVCTTKFNFKRNIAMVLYSGLILGCSCEIMYNRCFPILFGAGTAERNVVRALKMTLFDGFINAPLFWLPPAYIAQAIVYRYPKREAIQKYITDVKENGLLKKYWSLWLPMSMINFLFMPAHFRVAFVAMVSFFWMIILSIVANNDGDVESCPLEPEPAMLNPRALD